MYPSSPNLLCSGMFYCFLNMLSLPTVVTLTVPLPCTLLLECYSSSCWRCDIIALVARGLYLPHMYTVGSASSTLLSFLNLHTSTWIHFPSTWRPSMMHLWCVKKSFHLYLPGSISALLLFITISVHI